MLNFGGLSGGDNKCQTRANDPDNNPATLDGLGGTWQAWLSTSDVDAINRIPDDEYRLVDKITVVANSKGDLTDGTLDAPINKNEKGIVNNNDYVWTGTTDQGLRTMGTCISWTAGTPFGAYVGITSSMTSTWTYSAGVASCGGESLRLYCFEQ